MAIERLHQGQPLVPKEFYTPGEIAKVFGVTPKTVSNWCASGRIPCITTPSGHRRIPASALKGGREGLAKWEALQERLTLKTKGLPVPTDQQIADQVLARRDRQSLDAATPSS